MSSEYLAFNLCKQQLFDVYKYDSRMSAAASDVFTFVQMMRAACSRVWESRIRPNDNRQSFCMECGFFFPDTRGFQRKADSVYFCPNRWELITCIILSKLLAVPDSYTLKEAGLKTGSSLGLCPGKAPTSSQVTRGRLPTKPTGPGRSAPGPSPACCGAV